MHDWQIDYPSLETTLKSHKSCLQSVTDSLIVANQRALIPEEYIICDENWTRKLNFQTSSDDKSRSNEHSHKRSLDN